MDCCKCRLILITCVISEMERGRERGAGKKEED